MSSNEGFFVLTGGPGSGKSTLIEALSREGFACFAEAGRSVIKDQVAVGGRGLPWADRALYAELQLAWDLRSYHEAEALSGPAFFDRGIPDVLGYLRLVGFPVPAHLATATERFRYARRVFLFPPWPEIYAQDRERSQTSAEAERTFEAMVSTYRGCGYELLTVPRAPVEERVRFVLASVGFSTAS